MEDRHQPNFDIYEEGKLTLEECLGRVVFYHKRPFSLGASCSRNQNLIPR